MDTQIPFGENRHGASIDVHTQLYSPFDPENRDAAQKAASRSRNFSATTQKRSSADAQVKPPPNASKSRF